MLSEKKFIKNYLDTVVELSKETGMSMRESRTIIDIAISNQSPNLIDFNEIKKEIKNFITINIFSLLCKM